MSETPSSSPKRATPSAFLRGFNVEDLILYIFSLLTLMIFAIFFYQHYVTTVRPESAEPLGAAWLAPAGDDICLDYIKAQVTNIALRYDQAGIATATNAVRRSLAFLIGNQHGAATPRLASLHPPPLARSPTRRPDGVAREGDARAQRRDTPLPGVAGADRLLGGGGRKRFRGTGGPARHH
jgi:hypothetical protein